MNIIIIAITYCEPPQGPVASTLKLVNPHNDPTECRLEFPVLDKDAGLER